MDAVKLAQQRFAANRERPTRPGWLLIVGTLIVLTLNLLIVLNISLYQGLKLPGKTAGALVGVLLNPLICVALFQIGRRFRNARARWMIFFWASLVSLLITYLPKLGRLVQTLPS